MTLEEKKSIYELLMENLEAEVPHPLARVALVLTQNGIRSKEYGFAKMRYFLESMPEFLTVREVVLGINPQQEVILHAWDGITQIPMPTIMTAAKKEEKPVAPILSERVEEPVQEIQIPPIARTAQTAFSSSRENARENREGSRESGRENSRENSRENNRESSRDYSRENVRPTGNPGRTFSQPSEAPHRDRFQPMGMGARPAALTPMSSSSDRAANASSSSDRAASSTYQRREPMRATTTRTIQTETFEGIPTVGETPVAPTLSPATETARPAVETSRPVVAPSRFTTTPFRATAVEANPILSAADKQEIYQTLESAFPFEEKIHMAAISKYLNDNGYSKERYGFAKMKPLLESLGFLSMEEVLMNGVPQSLITMHLQQDWEVTTIEELTGQPVVPPQPQVVGLPAGMENLPITLHEVYLTPKTLAKLNQAVTGVEEDPSSELRSSLYNDYLVARQNGGITFRKDAVAFPLSMLDKDGNAMLATFKRSDRIGGLPWYLNFAGTDRSNSTMAPGKMLEQFAFLGSWSGFLDALAKKALPERWDFEGDNSNQKRILKKYIQYTFYRLQLEDKICISDDKTFAAFNTGLVSQHYDDIYACFESVESGRYDTQWRFLEFCTAASRGKGKRLVDYFNPLPQPASYFEKKTDLLFDLEKDLLTDFDHILLDNVSRLPIGFLREECHGAPDALEILDQIQADSDWRRKAAHYQELSELLEETPRLFNRLRNRIEDAIDLARKQVRWNFKTAIPCYYPTRNVMSLMLPLALQVDNVADAALVVEMTRSGNYQGQTILTLQQAYLDARLLCRPNSEWLDTDRIQADEMDEE